jgi:ketosteroid isomerase-like protein
MTTTEERNLDQTRHWEWTYNNEVSRMVDECYAENCEVRDMIRGPIFKGREELRTLEEQVLDLDPTRRMKLIKMVAQGDTVVAEVEGTFRDGSVVIEACIVLTYDADGFIVSDHTYSADPLGATVG